MKPLAYAALAVAGCLVLSSACGPKTNESQVPAPAQTPTDAEFQLSARIADSIRVADSIAVAAAAQPASMALDVNADGQSIFRHDTFGNEQFWSDKLRLHEIVTQKLDPTTALQLGLKVDAEALPGGALQGTDMTSPATTMVLLKANAIVGIRAIVDDNNHVSRLGVTCALCHSTVDNSVSEGIGRRMDGAPNRQINVGAIIALSNALSDEQRAVYNSWGPGKYDPFYNQDGKSVPVFIPPAYGLAQIDNVTYTAVGPISLWNQYVAVTQMHGIGPAPSLQDGMGDQPGSDAVTKPNTGNEQNNEQSNQQNNDLVTAKLPALRDYQHSLETPHAPEDGFDAAGATRGERVFRRACMSCHVGVTGTDNNSAAQTSEVTPGGGVRAEDLTGKGKLHAPAETGMDAQYAERTTAKGYRTTPLRGLAQHAPYFHDGSHATLDDVVTHYNKVLKLRLTKRQQNDLVEFLKSK